MRINEGEWKAALEHSSRNFMENFYTYPLTFSWLLYEPLLNVFFIARETIAIDDKHFLHTDLRNGNVIHFKLMRPREDV